MDKMKTELNENELDNVNGGTVIISKNSMRIVFDTQGVSKKLRNCTYKEARDYRDELMDENPNMPNSQFDAFCMQAFRNKGWIT